MCGYLTLSISGFSESDHKQDKIQKKKKSKEDSFFSVKSPNIALSQG